MDETEREPLLREWIKTMPPERFEQLVYELARREDSGVERLEHPRVLAVFRCSRRSHSATMRVWMSLLATYATTRRPFCDVPRRASACA
jgi:hypothetical protein